MLFMFLRQVQPSTREAEFIIISVLIVRLYDSMYFFKLPFS